MEQTLNRKTSGNTARKPSISAVDSNVSINVSWHQSSIFWASPLKTVLNDLKHLADCGKHFRPGSRAPAAYFNRGLLRQF